MPTLEDVVDSQVTVSDKAPSRPNFGMPLLAGYHTAWLDRVREYVDADDMLDDGFTTASPLYKMAVALKSQSPCPAKFKVGRLANAYTQTVTLTMESAVEGSKVVGEVNGEAISYTVPAAQTTTQVATAVELLVEAVTGISSTSALAVITAVSAAGALGTYYFERGVKIKDITADPGIAADLAAIEDADPSWYALLIDCNAEAIITAAATWTEAKKKIFITQSSDWDVVDPSSTTDIASDLKALAFARTAGAYHRGIGRTNDWFAAGWVGVCLASDPGSITWAFKTIAGVAVDVLKPGERTALTTKNWTQYESVNDLNITFEGKTPSGRFIDVTHGVDWLESEIELDQFTLLYNANQGSKLPFEQIGMDACTGKLEQTLQKGIKRTVLANEPAPTVTAPKLADTDVADRTARRFRTMEWDGRLSGALHGVRVRGRVSV